MSVRRIQKEEEKQERKTRAKLGIRAGLGLVGRDGSKVEYKVEEIGVCK